MESPPQPTHFQAPTIDELRPNFPAYDIEDFIAQGGMGAVYKARQISLDRDVAIKILPREFGEDPAFRVSFEAEAKAMAKLNHPNLIGIYDFGEVDGMLFLIMEFVHGKSLFHSSHGIRIDPGQAAEIIIGVCEGLQHAHAADILHRDVKPANILLTPDATPKIGDFGLAGPMNTTANPDDVVYGTPGYTAPEIINRQQADPRADIFSTGVMLHELLTGSLPDDTHTLPSVSSGCPVAFDAIVARSTNADPTLRYATAKEMAEDLQKALKSSATAARLNLTAAHSTSVAGQGAAGVSMPSSGTAIAPKKKSPAIAIIFFLLVAISLALYFLVSKNNQQPSENTAGTSKAVPVSPDTTPEPPETEKTTNPSKTPPPAVTERDKPPRKKESVSEALERLKPKLAGGDRDEFPEGTIEHQGSHFLVTDKVAGVREAMEFAKAHGAHLAVLSDDASKKHLLKSIPLKQSVWMGAGLAAHEKWQWMDQSAWNEPATLSPDPENRYLSMDKNGKLKAANKNATHAVLLQWRKDGSNPCTMESQLKRTVRSIKEKGIDQARYPVGTRTYKKSHFLEIEKSMSWELAHQFAKTNKAELAVPSDALENQWIAQSFAKPDAENSFWLGGYLLNQQSPWRWTTGEAWHSTGWPPGEPSKDYDNNKILAIIGTSQKTLSWKSSQGKKGVAKTILIEWSKPKSVSITPFDADKWLASVNRKMNDRIKPQVARYQKDRKGEIDSYIRDMKRAAKKMETPFGGRGGRGRRNKFIIDLVDKYMDEVEESGELPESIPERAPDAFHDIHDNAKETIKKLDTDHEEKLKLQLEFYRDGLIKKIDSLRKTGFNPAADLIEQSVEKANEGTDSFLKAIGL